MHRPVSEADLQHVDSKSFSELKPTFVEEFFIIERQVCQAPEESVAATRKANFATEIWRHQVFKLALATPKVGSEVRLACAKQCCKNVFSRV